MRQTFLGDDATGQPRAEIKRACTSNPLITSELPWGAAAHREQLRRGVRFVEINIMRLVHFAVPALVLGNI